jgi:hypothetical protein
MKNYTLIVLLMFDSIILCLLGKKYYVLKKESSMEIKKALLIKRIVEKKMLDIKENAGKCGETPCTTRCLACVGM